MQKAIQRESFLKNSIVIKINTRFTMIPMRKGFMLISKESLKNSWSNLTLDVLILKKKMLREEVKK